MQEGQWWSNFETWYLFGKFTPFTFFERKSAVLEDFLWEFPKISAWLPLCQKDNVLHNIAGGPYNSDPSGEMGGGGAVARLYAVLMG